MSLLKNKIHILFAAVVFLNVFLDGGKAQAVNYQELSIEQRQRELKQASPESQAGAHKDPDDAFEQHRR